MFPLSPTNLILFLVLENSHDIKLQTAAVSLKMFDIA